MTTTKQANAAAVSRFLKAQGFDRSETRTTSIRGWYTFSSGFVAFKARDGVRVSRVRGDTERHVKDFPARAHADLDEYAKALVMNGYTVEYMRGENEDYLRVTR